ncbi:site-specific integrase [Actinomadura viridis]|uniref:site-specific integrase n=1 Tax=Actinomadura viridis TaxID=58110 RepID=UPI003691D7F1
MTAVEPARSPVVVRPELSQPVAYTDADFTIAAETVDQLINARPENTRRTYKWVWDQFECWCNDEGRVALPATAQTLTDYVARLIGADLSPATVDNAIGAIRSEHRRAGHRHTPDTEAALELLRAYRRDWTDNGNCTHKAKPLLLDALRTIIDKIPTDTLAGTRDRALLLLGFNMMARRSELSRLNHSDLSEGDEGLTVHVRRSKTDQSAMGAEVNVPFGQHAETCAVRAVAVWRARLSERGLSNGALFRPIDRHGRIGGEPETAGRAAERLTGKSISDIVHRRAVEAGLRDHYTGHSLRAGAATSAYAAGVPVSVIAAHGRWAEKSPVVLSYIRAVDKWKNNPMKGIGL